MTQSDLAQASGVSLPFIQLIEANKANPSIETLEAILKNLGFELKWEAQKTNWDELIEYGLPLSSTTTFHTPPGLLSQVRFLQLTRMALHEIRQSSLHSSLQQSPSSTEKNRYEEALSALLLALQNHFPSFFKKHYAKSPWVKTLLTQAISGRVIKLSRMSLARLAEWL